MGAVPVLLNRNVGSWKRAGDGGEEVSRVAAAEFI